MRPIWQEAPIHFKRDVVSRLDLKSRTRLSMCSSIDQHLVSSSPLSINELHVNLGETKSVILKCSTNMSDEQYTIKNHPEPLKCIFHLLKHPRTTCKRLKFISYSSDIEEHFIAGLVNQFTMQLKVEKLQCQRMKTAHILRILPMIDPLRLRTLLIHPSDIIKKQENDTIVRSQHWKNLKKVRVETNNSYFLTNDILHLERVSMHVRKASPEEAWAFIQSFRQRDLPYGSYFYVTMITKIDFGTVLKLFDVTPENKRVKVNARSQLQRIPVPSFTQRFSTCSADKRKLLIVRFYRQISLPLHMVGVVTKMKDNCEFI